MPQLPGPSLRIKDIIWPWKLSTKYSSWESNSPNEADVEFDAHRFCKALLAVERERENHLNLLRVLSYHDDIIILSRYPF